MLSRRPDEEGLDWRRVGAGMFAAMAGAVAGMLIASRSVLLAIAAASVIGTFVVLLAYLERCRGFRLLSILESRRLFAVVVGLWWTWVLATLVVSFLDDEGVRLDATDWLAIAAATALTTLYLTTRGSDR